MIKQYIYYPEMLCSIHEHNTIAQAAKMMDEKRVGCLLVFDSKK
jgi:predicted transcriptional regulator